MSGREELSAVMIAIFRRKGEITLRTRPIDERLPDGKRAALAEILAAAEGADALPVLFSENDAGGLVLLTTRGIITEHGGVVREIRYGEIAEVGADMVREAARGIRNKHAFAVLRLTLRSGEAVHVETEPGMPYWGILNAVEFAVRRSRAAAATTNSHGTI